MKKLKIILSHITVVTTILWSAGFYLFTPQVALAAITATGPSDFIPSGGMHAPPNSFDMPILKFSLTQSASETLSTVTLTLSDGTGFVTTANHISNLSIFRDANGNNSFDPQNGDVLAGTQTSVNVGSATSITASSNNSLAASGSLATTFFVTLKTASTWFATDGVKVSMAANGIATSANSPTVTALTGVNVMDGLTGGAGGGGGAGFGILKVGFVSPTTVDISFTDLLDTTSSSTTSTAYYAFTGTGAATVTSVTLLPDNKSVRVVAATATMVGTGSASVTVSPNVKNQFGAVNSSSAATPITDSFQPLVISEIKAGSATDQFDEFVELYNRSDSLVGTSSLKLHLVNTLGTVDVNVPLTFMLNASSSAHGFFLIAPVTSPASSTADAVYSTSSIASIVPNGALYISNSTASSTAVIDRVCWGTHANTSGDCEGSTALALANDGTSLERKPNNASTAATMLAADATSGNGQDSNNNSFDFVARATPQPQNSLSATEAPSGGSFGGAGNAAPGIQHTPLFNATASSSLNLVARLTDDGGALSASKALFIYCTTNTACAPVSTTPVYGTDIGSGWFKFTLTSSGTPWSNHKTLLKYYLQATDNATPAKTKVFTADPNFDSSFDVATGGIQTAALQQSKALSITLTQGDLGAASITGIVNNSSSVGVSGATVWIEGTQFSATTGNDGSFSFSNVGPSGGKQLKVAKDNFADQSSSIFVPPSGLVSLPAITMYGGTMGVGGDFNGPKIMGSNPPPNSNSFPTQGPSGGAPTILLFFNKSMDSTTIASSDASVAAATIYLTEAGSNTKLAGSVTYASATNQATFTPSAALTVGKGYTLYVTPAVKDTAGNPVTGNGPGGQFVLMFSTAGQFFSSISDITSGGGSFGMGNAFPPYIKGGMPAPGAQGVGRNSKGFILFSEQMQDTSANRAYVKLYKVTSAYTASESKTEVASVTNSFDTTGKILIISAASALDASSHYRFEVQGGIASAKGMPLGNPGVAGYATQVFYKGDFDTGSALDSTAPTVLGTVPAASATGVSTINTLTINFSEAMDPSTITSNSVILKLGSTSVDGTLTYDANSWTGKFSPTYALTASSTYTLDVTTAVKDLAGNALGSELLRTFTTGSADTTAPTVVSAQGNDFAVKIVFSKPMLAVPNGDINYTSSVLKPENYTIKRVSSLGATSSTISMPATATVTYDPGTRSVAINGFSVASFGTAGTFVAGTTLLNFTVAGVKDSAFNSIDITANTATSTAESSSAGGGFGGGGGFFQDASGNAIQGGQFGPPPTSIASFTGSGIGFIPAVHVLPFSAMSGVSTIYGIDAPISKQVPANGYIDIVFPDGTDVSQAKQDTNSPKNTDMNGPGLGTVVFATSEGTIPTGWTTGGVSNDGVIVNASASTVRVILGTVATRSESSDTHDFLRFDIAQVTNPSTVTALGTAGNTASVITKKADGTVVETLSSGSFFTTAAGSFTLRGQVLAGATGINQLNVFLFSPQTGPLPATNTAANRYASNNGEFVFQNLVSGNYMLGVQPSGAVGATRYSPNSPPQPVNINGTTCTANICTQNVAVTDASTGAGVTLNISGAFSATGDAVDIFAGGPNAFRIVTTTLTGTLTNNTSNSIKLNTNGLWTVGFGPSMSADIFGKGNSAVRPNWIMPRPQQVTVSGCPTACAVTPNTLTFSSAAVGSNPVKFVVQDSGNNKIGQAHVFAYSPGAGLGNDTTANADGTGSLSLAVGTYKIAAGVPGMPTGIERTIAVTATQVFIDGSATGITLSTMTNSQLVLLIPKSSTSYTISGKVTDGTNPVSNAPVSAYRTNGPGFANTFTNSSGEYTLYVFNGTWNVSAFLSQQFGKLPEKSVTVSGANVSSQNFEPNTSSINYATSTISIYVDLNGDGVSGGGEAASTTQVTVEGTTGDMNNDGDTADAGENAHYINTVLTDTNGSSTLKVPPGTYTVKAWSPTAGDLPAFNSGLVVNGAGTATTAPNDLVAPKTGTVTVNVLDSAGNATSTDKMVIEFEQIGGKTDNAGAFNSVSSTTFTLPIYDAGASNLAIGASTSTNPANFYLMKITCPGISAANLSVYGADTNTIMATSSVASGLYKVEVDSNETINVRLPAVNYVRGTVLDSGSTAVADAIVHIENKTTGETVEVKADSSGNYSTKLSSGTYLIQSEKDGYIDTAATFVVNSSGAMAATATTMTAATLAITGTITAGGSAVSGATVRAEQLGGPAVTATTATDGTYSLAVTTGDWKVSATADGYTEKAYATVVNVTANVTGINISLATTNTSLAGSTALSVTPQSGGTLTDSTANMAIKAPQSSIANSSNSYSLSEKETSNVVAGGTGTPISGEAKSVTSYTNDGNDVTTLNSSVAITTSYSTSELASTLGTLTLAKTEDVKVGSWDSTTDNWEHLPTTIAYKDSSGNFVEPTSNLSNVASVSYTGQTTHFSVFNAIGSPDGLVPAAPTGLSGTFNTGVGVAVTWTAVTTNADGSAIADLLGYEIYRSTSAAGTFTQLNTSDISGANYTDTTAVQNVTYYYKVTAADTGGNESAMSSVSSGVLITSITGGRDQSSSGSSGGGGGGGAAPAPTPAPTTAPAVPAATTAPATTEPSTTAPSTVTTVPATAEVMHPDSAVIIDNLPLATLKAGATLKFTYEYQNESAKPVRITVVRQLVNSKNKVVASARSGRTLKPGALLEAKVTQALPRALTPGEYTVKVKILDTKGKVLEENSFVVTVEKPAPLPKAKVKAKAKVAAPAKSVKKK